MAPSTRDRISVDLRGLKAALFEQARAHGVSPSVWVRDTLAVAVGRSDPNVGTPIQVELNRPTDRSARLSLRMRHEDAVATLAAARAAGLAPGAFVAGLVAGVPVLTSGASRADHIATLVASCAELSTLSRNIHRLTALLRQANIEPARQYRDMLDTLAGDVRAHLRLAASALADLQPHQRHVDAPTNRTS
jgi:hypothetical protein